MKIKALLIIDQIKKIDQLKAKISNLKEYCQYEEHTLALMVVVLGDAVVYFKDLVNEDQLLDPNIDIALCNNSLAMRDLAPIDHDNIRTVHAGIGEVLVKKTLGWQDYLI